jgi:hypothetical protein
VEHGQSRAFWHRQLEQFELLAVQLRIDVGQARHIPARTSHAGHESGPDGITDSREHDRYRRRLRSGRLDGYRPANDQDVDFELDERGRHGGCPIERTI